MKDPLKIPTKRAALIPSLTIKGISQLALARLKVLAALSS
jgi:hypothetical protein